MPVPRRHRPVPTGPWLALIVLLVLGCSRDAGRVQVSEDSRLQLKYEVASRNLNEIRARQERGEDVAGDCQAVRMLFIDDLARIDHPRARRVLQGLRATCAAVRGP
jgi:hypothetical protein